MTNTTEHVWLSPRAVRAELIQAMNSEAERFLFYRGVAHLDAPLKISREGGQLVFRSHLDKSLTGQIMPVQSIWFVDIRANGKVAFRKLPPIQLDPKSDKILATTPSSFNFTDFSASNLEKLKKELHSALLAEGLFPDEAQALLNTWELSYFKSAGLRVFFLVPRAWTDFYLPLEISLPSKLNRVMVGRIELVTPDQRQKLREIGHFTDQKIKADAEKLWKTFYTSTGAGVADWQQLSLGKKHLAESISVPKTYQAYLDLGRFRNALILDEAKNHPTPALAAFIDLYRLGSYKPAEPSATP